MNNALDSPTAISGSTRSLQRCITNWFLIYTCSGTSPVSIGMGCLSPMLGQSLSPSSAAQRWPLSTDLPGFLQDNAVAISYLTSKGNITPLLRVLPGIPASSQFNPICSWAFLPSCQIISLVTNYHCWAVTIWISPSFPPPFVSSYYSHTIIVASLSNSS